MGRLSVLALQVILCLVFAGALFVQCVMVPMTTINEANNPASGRVQSFVFLGYLAVAALITQVCIVCVWKLLSRVRRGTVFNPVSFKFVDVIIWSLTVGSLTTFVFAWLMAPGEDIAPGVVLLFGGLGMVLAGISLIVLVLRHLLAQAANTEALADDLRAELGEVI